ncbi:MAG TPA: MFS transporter [Mycobacterium sp.]
MGRHSVGARAARLHHPRILVAAMAAAGIGVSLMQTLIIPVLPELPTLLNTSPANASWAITATLLTAAIATPVFGRLGDMHGPRPMLICCAVFLTAGSLLAASTSSLLPLIIGRGLQGFGMPIIPLGISVLRACVPAEKVGAAMGMMSASLGVGGALGLPLAAGIAQHFEWHALFWLAAVLGVGALLLFTFMVPRIPARSTDRFDPLGTVLLAGGLVALLLPISKGGTWGWTAPTTLGLFASSLAIFAVFGWWQLRVSSPIVDLRTTARRPVLTTNLASVGVGFSLFALSLIAPQVLELPAQTGYGLGQSMLHAGLWMAPGGVAMMLSAPLAAKIAARRGPKFTLVIGCLIIAGSYLAGLALLSSPARMMVLNVAVSVGVGFAFSSLPALINAAVPVSETAAANGINALARSLGTSTSSAVMGAVLAGITVSFHGHEVPTLRAFHVALLIAAGAAVVATFLALLIPGPAAAVEVSGPPLSVERTDWALTEETEDYLRQLEYALTMLGRYTAIGPYSDAAQANRDDWLDRSAYLLLSRIEDSDALSVAELADAFELDAVAVQRQAAVLLRNDLLDRSDDPVRRLRLTPRGRERLYRHRTHKIDGLRQVLDSWSAADIEVLASSIGRLVASIDTTGHCEAAVTEPIRRVVRGRSGL